MGGGQAPKDGEQAEGSGSQGSSDSFPIKGREYPVLSTPLSKALFAELMAFLTPSLVPDLDPEA